MTATIESSIWLGFRRRLETFTTFRPFDIAWPGEIYSPSNRLFLTPTITFARPEKVTLSQKPSLRKGIFMVRVAAPLGAASEVALQVASEIGQFFPADLPLRFNQIRFKVEGDAEVVGGYRDDGFWNVPVKINWQAFA